MRDNNSSPQPTENCAVPGPEEPDPLNASPPPNSSPPLDLRLDLDSSPAALPIQLDLSPSILGRRDSETEYPAQLSQTSPTANPLAKKSRFWRFEPPQLKPLFRGFERPSFSHIAILAALCLITYPAFFLLTLVAKDKTLFIVRAIVSVWCWAVGFALGWVLLRIGAQHIEAASAFTLV